MPKISESNIDSLRCLPSLQAFFSRETGRSTFFETVLQIVDACGFRREFDGDLLSCIQVKNHPYPPLFLNSECKLVDGSVMFRQVDVRMPKYRALFTGTGFPLSVVLQVSTTVFIRYDGLVLEREYGGAYTGNVDHLDLIGLAECLAHLELWRGVIVDAGYCQAAATAANVMYTNNKYVFDRDFKTEF